MEMKENSTFKPEITFEGDIPLPPSIRPVIILQGSDYDIGYQYYHQILQIFGKWVATHYSSNKPALEYGEHGVWANWELKSKQFSKQELSELNEYEKLIKKFAPEWIDICKGMAAAATDSGTSLSYLDILKRLTNLSYFTRPDYPVELLKKDPLADAHGGCSGFAAWGKATRDGKLIASSSGDAQGSYFATTVIVFPETGNNFIVPPESALGFGLHGMHPAMNNKGLVYVHHGAGNPVDGKPGYGVPEGIACLHTLRFANNAAEAEALQLSYPLTNKVGGLWADVNGNAFCIECRDPKAIRRPGYCGEKDFIYVANNRLCRELDRGDGDTYVPHGGWIGSKNASKEQIARDICSIPRNLQMYDLLIKGHGKVDLEYVMMMWRNPGNPPAYPTIEEAIDAYVVNGGKGWDIKIGSLYNSLVGIVAPDNGNEGLYYICNGSAGRIVHPYAPTAFRYAIAPTYTFYKLKLASNPEEVAISARVHAQHGLYYASTELRKLNYLDNGYAALDEIINDALKEWFKGEYVLGLAVSNKENATESLYNYAKSTRCYTKCQALAQKVFDALVPPATSN